MCKVQDVLTTLCLTATVMMTTTSTEVHGFSVGRVQTIRTSNGVWMSSSITSSDVGIEDGKEERNEESNENRDKEMFLNSLSESYKLNAQSKERSFLLNKMIYNKQVLPAITLSSSNQEGSAISIENPGSVNSMKEVASGTWKVVYAPHMTTMAKLGGGQFDVQYILNDDFTMESHAKYDFPFFKQKGYLSVSGTYGSVNDLVCRVDFDQAWIKQFDTDIEEKQELEEDVPYASIQEVPDSTSKQVITNIGKLLFLEQFSVFPISYLDDDLIVFDFELLGTRICARKIK